MQLNTGLTVRKAEANSHNKKRWQKFTDVIIRLLSKEKSGLVFLLWGRNAQNKSKLIDSKRHTVLQSAHPSGVLLCVALCCFVWFVWFVKNPLTGSFNCAPLS